jgi:type I restriction enzyme R subunit
VSTQLPADPAYQNARRNSDKQNARIEMDHALLRVMVALMSDDTQLFKQYSDNPAFKRWLRETTVAATYNQSLLA